MEVRKGYKMTDVGVIPMDWVLLKISEFTNVVSGGTPSTAVKEFWGGDIRWMNSGELNLKKIYEVGNRITELGLNNSATQIVPENCILIGLAGQGKTRGTAAINKVKLCTNQSIAAILPSRNVLHDYLYFSIDNKYAELRNLSTGDGGRGGLNLNIIKNLIIPVPSLTEQTAIATALSDTDSLINSLEKLIAKKRNIKQGAMQKLLQPKEGWKVKKLGECLLLNPEYGINAAAVPFNDCLPTYLRITDISDDGKYIEQNKVSVNHPLSHSFFLEEGDIVFARTGASVGKSYLYDIKDGELVFAGFLIRFKIDRKILNPVFLKYLTRTKIYWDWVNSNSMRSGQPGLNSNEYKSFSFIIPNITAQIHIATILSDMDAEISALQSKLDKYKKIKAGMMQQLLTGKIRLV